MTPFLVSAVMALVPHGAAADCHKTFTYQMDRRAADAIYAGTRDMTRHNRRLLARLEHCQRPVGHPQAHRAHATRARRYNATRRSQWAQRRLEAAQRRQQEILDAQMAPAIASWYDTEGVGACGYGTVQTGYRFASLILPCGAIVRFCHGSLCIDGEMADHGPYVAGRTFDFNVNMKNALGCGGVCYVTWRRL